MYLRRSILLLRIVQPVSDHLCLRILVSGTPGGTAASRGRIDCRVSPRVFLGNLNTNPLAVRDYSFSPEVAKKVLEVPVTITLAEFALTVKTRRRSSSPYYCSLGLQRAII